MAELIDLLCIFWFVLAVGVYIIGNLFDKQLQQEQQLKSKSKNNNNNYSGSSGNSNERASDRLEANRTNLDKFWPQQQAQNNRSNSSGYGVEYCRQPNIDSDAYNSAAYNSNYQQNDQSNYINYSNSNSNNQYHCNYNDHGKTTTTAAAAATSQFPVRDAYNSSPMNDQAVGDYFSKPLGSYNLDDHQPLDPDYKSAGLATGMHGFGGGGPYEQDRTGLGSSSSIPTATGFNSDCVEWVNSILYLFYTQTEKYGPIIIENVYRSLNEKLSNLTSSSSEYSNLLIEFDGINSELSTRPELTNIRTEIESDKSISATCKIYNKCINFNLCIKRLLNRSTTTTGASGATTDNLAASGSTDAYMLGGFGGGGGVGVGLGVGATDEDCVVRYEMVLENLEGKLKSIAMLSDRLIVIQFIEKPDTKILLRQIPTTAQVVNSSTSAYYSPKAHHQHQQQQQQQLISEDVLVQMILQTLTQVVVDLYFGNDVDFPQYKHNHHHSSSLSAVVNYKNRLNNMIRGSASELKRQIKNDFFGALSSSSSPPLPTSLEQHDKERKVFVKIIRAKNINYNQNVTCLMELDTPRQQAISSTKQGSSPYWDEHFLFNVNVKSSELCFELWDSINVAAVTADDELSGSLKRNQQQASGGGAGRTNATKWHKSDLTGTAAAKFLGLARVQIDDLRQNPMQKVSLSLQPISGAPSGDLNNSVGGELQLELLFLEHSAHGSGSGANTSASATLPGSPLLAGADQLRKSNSLSSLAYQQGDIVSIDRKLTPSGYVITTTTITKQQPVHSRQQQQKYHDQLMPGVRNQSPSMTTEHSFDDTNDLDGMSALRISAADYAAAGKRQQQHQHHDHQQADRRSEGTGGVGGTSGPESSIGGGRLSRSRSRSRSFIRAIRKRFSLSQRARARSVGEATGAEPGAQSNRRDTSQSGAAGAADHLDAADLDSRSRTVSEVSIGEGGGGGGAGRFDDSTTSRAKSMPPRSTRDGSEVPTIVINKSRLSDTASAFTFTHPKSQLVIEVLEPTLRADGNGNNKTKGVYRYYAIPDSAAAKRKWRRRGTKLHLFNEHLFVACHLAGSSTCHLCGRVFSRRPGKQGYKCRNCHLLSHKQCHVKVDHNCPYATSTGLQLEYIDADPPASLMDELSSRPHSPQSANSGGDLSMAASCSMTTTTGTSRSGGGGAGSGDPYQTGRMRSSGSVSGGGGATRPNMRMAAKSISMEVEER